MFVDISDFKGAIAIENLLMPYKKGRLASDKKTRLPKEQITPQICMQILKSTNNPVNIKRMLECIAELPEVEQAQFKDIVLSTFDNRCQPDAVVEVGRNLAKTSHYEDAFELMLSSHHGDMLKSDASVVKTYGCSENVYQAILKNYNGRLENLTDYDKLLCLTDEDEFLSCYPSAREQLKYPKIVEIPFADKVNLQDADMSNTQKIVTHENAIVDLCDAVGLHENLEIPYAEVIRVNTPDIDLLQTWKCRDDALMLDLRRKKILYEKDFSLMGNLDFRYCDFAENAKILTRDGVKMRIQNATPCGFDFAKCADLALVDCDLLLYDELKFRKKARVLLQKVVGCPQNLDFSECDEVILHDVSLKNCSGLRFKNGAKVKFIGDVELPPNIDLSVCSEMVRQIEWTNGINCRLFDILKIETAYDGCWLNFDDVDNPNFKDGAKLSFTCVQNFFPNTDFSKCSEVAFIGCNLYGLKKLSLQNCDEFILRETSNLPEIVGIENCAKVVIRECDLAYQKGWRFKDGAKVDLSESKNLPEDLNFFECAAVDLSHCDLSSFKDLKFAQNAVVILDRAKYIPENLDVSKCKEFSAEWGDFTTLTELHFAKGAKVNLTYAKKLPKNVDFSQCAEVCLRYVNHFPEKLDFSQCLEVDLRGAYLALVQKLVFGECTNVNLKNTEGLPKQIDFSSCREVCLEGANLLNVQQISFKNREQMERSRLKVPVDWQGKLIFADELPTQGGVNMAALSVAKGGR